MVLHEVEQGATINFVQNKYDIKGGSTVHNCIKTFGKHYLLNKIIRKKRWMNVIEMGNDFNETDFKKNFGTRSAGGLKVAIE